MGNQTSSAKFQASVGKEKAWVPNKLHRNFEKFRIVDYNVCCKAFGRMCAIASSPPGRFRNCRTLAVDRKWDYFLVLEYMTVRGREPLYCEISSF